MVVHERTTLNSSQGTNITPVLAPLGLDSPDKAPPEREHIPFPNAYDRKSPMPLRGDLTLERLVCNVIAISKKDTYVRAVLNEAAVPITSCQDGPGFSFSDQLYCNGRGNVGRLY